MGYNSGFRRCVFSSRRHAAGVAAPLSWLAKAGSHLFALSFPDDCRVCGAPLTEYTPAPVCAKCLEDLEVFEPDHFCQACRTPFLRVEALDEAGLCRLCRMGLTQFNAAYGYAAYDDRMRALIHLLKYEGMKPLGKPMGRWLARAMPQGSRYDALVPVPLHWWKRVQRGYNQTELLAQELSRHCGVPVLCALRRKKRSGAQAGLSRSARRRNVRGVFAAVSGVPVTGQRLLLIDDVLTSGATANACASVLRRAGAERVDVLTLARTDKRFGGGDDFPVFVHSPSGVFA